jgi:hypothetical protein
MAKKTVDDTQLEFYWLTPKDIEKIKQEDEIDGEDLHKAMKIVEVAYYLWIDVDLDDALNLVEKSKKNAVHVNLQEVF